ncbi:hypothetical protein ACSHWB_37680 [Lentzea sp. HUAS TT2]|uniref:hypothetical protein n=1 Tax=Lentzea sp. HUAS TT2 TaxID=3447454 RepID=UPI003F724D67
MRRRKVVIGLFAAMTLVSMSTASAQTESTSPPPPQPSFSFTVSPTVLQPGETIYLELKSWSLLDGRCGGLATSPGFAAPIYVGRVGHSTLRGHGPVVRKPGDYVAAVPCASGTPMTAKFTIVGSDTTPTTTPPTRVTPIGPPQTGGGGTAES